MRELPLTQGKVALVDDEDFDALSRWKWSYVCNTHSKTGYARRAFRLWTSKKSFTMLMHIQILGSRDGYEIDHIDGNGCNNQRYNLRFATCPQNHQNIGLYASSKSGYRGVTLYKRDMTWRADITVDGNGIFLGYFDEILDAVCTYDNACRQYFGEFAQPNFKS